MPHIRSNINFSNAYYISMVTCMVFQADDKSCELGGGSSDEDEKETGGDVDGHPETSSGEDKELKNRLLNKYSGYLSSLWRELSSKKKKKGKLPWDAREKLLHWWQLHYRWPYPSVRVRTIDSCACSFMPLLCMVMLCVQCGIEIFATPKYCLFMQELEKAALAESTGLDAKQINNWFINQRKRHWKPAPPPMLATTVYRLQPHSGGASSSSTAHHAALRADGQYFTGGSACPRGP
jgi:hypothetical protein